jgi:hypothetical protein
LKRRYVYDYGRPGRPKVKVSPTPPKDFSRLIELMPALDARGWYRELTERLRREYLEKARETEDQIVNQEEIDRVLCRTDVVAVCNTSDDLEVARYNGRIVLELDPVCPDKMLFSKIGPILNRLRRRAARRINTKAWVNHKILVLYEYKLMGYDVSKDRKQLAVWLYPEIKDEIQRGDKLDSANKYLEAAVASLTALRAQSA